MIAQRQRPWDWELRFAEHLARWREREFVWGRSDCVQFVAEWAGYLLGDDGLAARYLGAYQTDLEAARWLEDGGLTDAVSEELGSPVGVFLARRGDVVLFDGVSEVGEVLGLCDGEVAWFLGVGGGLASLRLRDDVMLAWRVGD